MDLTKNGVAITTRDLKVVFELQQKLEKLGRAASVINARKKKVREEYNGKSQLLIKLINQDTPIKSNKYIVTVKDHDEAAYINWQKEFRANHPEEYKAIVEESGRKRWQELCIAESVVE